jgi:hypothetical protein
MAELRATADQLLDYLETQVGSPGARDVIAELRRRGDVVVAMNDLRVLGSWASLGASCSPEDSSALDAAIDGIEASLGGPL